MTARTHVPLVLLLWQLGRTVLAWWYVLYIVLSDVKFCFMEKPILSIMMFSVNVLGSTPLVLVNDMRTLNCICFSCTKGFKELGKLRWSDQLRETCSALLRRWSQCNKPRHALRPMTAWRKINDLHQDWNLWFKRGESEVQHLAEWTGMVAAFFAHDNSRHFLCVWQLTHCSVILANMYWHQCFVEIRLQRWPTAADREELGEEHLHESKRRIVLFNELSVRCVHQRFQCANVIQELESKYASRRVEQHMSAAQMELG